MAVAPRVSMSVTILVVANLWLVPPPTLADAAPATDGGPVEAHDMALLGHHDLQGRSAYQPSIHHQGNRWIAYIGHHGGKAFDPLTGEVEFNGTSIVDVTDHPREVAYFIPAITDRTCEKESDQASCRRVIQTNNVETDDRGLIYIVDRADTGLDILKLTGDAAKIAGAHN